MIDCWYSLMNSRLLFGVASNPVLPAEVLRNSTRPEYQILHFSSDIMRVRPVCFGNGGTWKPTRLNECFKFGKYVPGGHFNPHIDGPWVPRYPGP